MRAAVLLALLFSMSLGGCTLFDDPPDRSCTQDNDCFMAQGEVCNTVTKKCEVPMVDASAAQAEDLDEEDVASEVAP